MTFSLTARLLASALVLSGFSGAASAQQQTPEQPAEAVVAVDPEAVVATIGDQKITEADVAMATTQLSQQFAQLPPEQRRMAIISALIDVKALAEKASAEGLQDDPEIARELALVRDRALHNAYFEKHGVEAITEEELHQRYDAEKARFQPQDELHARHILVETEDEAKSIIERLDKGEKFEDLAKELSRDPSSQNGGDLGFFTRGRMVPQFEEAAFALEPGKHSETPVETQFGWHVIEAVETRKTEFPPFEQLRDQARQVVMQEKYVEMLQSARDELKVEYVDPEVKKQVEALESGMNQGEIPAEGAPQQAE